MRERSGVAARFAKIIILQYLLIVVHILLIFVSRYRKTASMYSVCS